MYRETVSTASHLQRMRSAELRAQMTPARSFGIRKAIGRLLIRVGGRLATEPVTNHLSHAAI
jgi:hypothetical protein